MTMFFNVNKQLSIQFTVHTTAYLQRDVRNKSSFSTF